MNIKKYYKKYRELIMYLIFGVLTTLIGLILYFILTILFFNPNNPYQLQLANIISWLGSVLFAYITNRNIVFQSKNKKKIKELSKFFIARIITLILDVLIMGIGVTLLKYNDRIIKVISQVIIIVSNYLFSKLLVFKGSD